MHLSVSYRQEVLFSCVFGLLLYFFLRTIPLCFFLLGCWVRLLVAPTVNMRSLSIAVILMRAGILQKSVGVFLQNQNVPI